MCEKRVCKRRRVEFVNKGLVGVPVKGDTSPVLTVTLFGLLIRIIIFNLTEISHCAPNITSINLGFQERTYPADTV